MYVTKRKIITLLPVVIVELGKKGERVGLFPFGALGLGMWTVVALQFQIQKISNQIPLHSKQGHDYGWKYFS